VVSFCQGVPSYRVCQKVISFWYPSFLPLLDALYLQFLFTYISFSLNAWYQSQVSCRQYRWTLSQDGAPSHTAKNTINYLKRENVSFIKPQMWSPNSPDLNPVDYAVWGALQQHNRKFTTVDQLKQAIVEEWNKLSQRFIDRSIDEWRRRLTRVVQQQGGHTEHITLRISSSECWNCSNSVNIWCLLVYMTLYWHSWQGCHFFGTPCMFPMSQIIVLRSNWHQWRKAVQNVLFIVNYMLH